jgi:hypothetical protein
MFASYSDTAQQAVGQHRVEQAVLAAEVAVELCLVGARRRDDAVDPGTGDAAFRELLRGRVEYAPAGGGPPRRCRQFGHAFTLTDRPVGLLFSLPAASF